MSIKTALIGVGLVGASIVFCGCQTSLCPDGERLVGEGRAREAILAYKQCRETEKNPKRIEEINAEIRELAPGIVQPVVDRLDRQAPSTIPEYDQAITELEDVQPFDEPGAPWKIAEKAASYKGQRQKLEQEVRALLAKAAEHRQAQRWKEAAASVSSALAKHPDRPDALELRRGILAERDEHYTSQIAALCTAERWKEASELLDRFKTEEPQPQVAVIQMLTKQVEKIKADVIRRSVEKDINEKRYFAAYHRLLETQASGCADLLETIKRDGYSYYVSVADEKLNDVSYFYAYAAAVKARELPKPASAGTVDPEGVTFEKHRECADLVDDSIRVELCIAAFDSPQVDAAAGKEFADRLVADLHPVLPYGLRLDDRRKVEYERAEDAKELRDALRLVGISWAVQGSLSVNIVKDHQERDKTSWVDVEQTIINPQYEVDVAALQKEYGQDSSKWPREPKRTIREKLTKEVTYKTGTERMEGEIAVSTNIYSAAEGAITQSRSFRVAKDLNDTFSDGIEQAGIKADAMEMISQLVFRQQIEQELRQQIMAWVLGNFTPRQQKFCEQAEYHMERREWDQAVKAAAQGYYYCLRDNVPQDDKWFVKLRQLTLFDLTESTPGRGAAGI